MILSRELRKGTEHTWFKTSGDMRLPASVLPLAQSLDLSPGTLMAIAGLHRIYHWVIARYLRDARVCEQDPHFFIGERMGFNELEALLKARIYAFPSNPLYLEEIGLEEAVEALRSPTGVLDSPLWDTLLQDVFYQNPALEPYRAVFSNKSLVKTGLYESFQSAMSSFLSLQKAQGNFAKVVDSEGNIMSLIDILLKPARKYPTSLMDQLDYIQKHWGSFIDHVLLDALLQAQDVLKDEIYAPRGAVGGAGAAGGVNHDIELPALGGDEEIEAFSEDRHWMPRVVMIAKNTLVWLHQLRVKYNAPIYRLDQIPDEELDQLASWGFTGLWLIGLWERSEASQRIKQICGNPDAAASAYSLKGYHIAKNLGGEAALEALRDRCAARGIRLGSDMVPNHTGLDAYWLKDHPEYYLQAPYSPYPNYSYKGEDLSRDWDIELRIEDHYFDQSDAAVVFQHRDKRTGQVRYIYHGNDGTTMPWNDTAQLDYTNPETREAVIQAILHVARNFPIIRFDAAMTLAKKHVRRLWFPAPGDAGAIASRAMYSMSDAEFNERVPHEFWREVVDRVAEEVPDCLLLAEAFWMMESYFVRTLGMHRVYNSAFMHMLKNEDNQQFRAMVKDTLAFDPDILQRYVNFMSNPDEETALEQFGDGGKYFAVATVLATLPGLPMIAHGQMEGFKEKYGMEYQRSYWDEQPNGNLIAEHERSICPIFKARRHFAGAENFAMYDFETSHGIAESVYAYTNALDGRKSLTLVNNSYTSHAGRIAFSTSAKHKASGELKTIHIAEALGAVRGGQGYIMYYSVPAGAYFLLREQELFDNGLYLELNGYDRIVAWDIQRVEGLIYDELWAAFGRSAIADIAIAHARLALKRSREVLVDLMSLSLIPHIQDSDDSDFMDAWWIALKRNFEQLERVCVEDMHLDSGSAADRWEMVKTRMAMSLKLLSLAEGDEPYKPLGAISKLNPSFSSLALLASVVAPLVQEMPEGYGVHLYSDELHSLLSIDAHDFEPAYMAELMVTLAGDSFIANPVENITVQDAATCLAPYVRGRRAERILQVHWSDGKQYYRKENFYGYVWSLVFGSLVSEGQDFGAARVAELMTLLEQWCVLETKSRWLYTGLLELTKSQV